MKLKRIIYIAFLSLLASCSDELTSHTYTVGEADNAICLKAGVSDGGGSIATRAGAESNHSNHTPFTEGTQLRLKVDGVWKGHDPEDISINTTASIGSIATGTHNKHNTVTFTDAEAVYWDNFGTADPNNMSGDGNGRDRGLTIYGVAVDGNTPAPSVSIWTQLEWKVGEPTDNVIDQSGTDGWSAKDLLASNNVQTENGALPYSTDGTYKFDNRDAVKLLEFTHAMTKITVNLTAAEGFPGYETNVANAKFQRAPEVTLLGFNYMGEVDVENKTSTATATDGSATPIATANFKTYRDNGTAWASGGQHTSQFTALVFPGNRFADATNIIKLEVDGNTLYINATEINKVNQHTNNDFEQGKNYIFNIIVKKTGIIVTATIKDWVDVTADEEAPKINIDYAYGHVPGSVLEDGFTLYRSETITGSYIGTGDNANVTYVAADGDPVVPAHYTMTPQLYWPTHSTHYFFRGVWPTVGSVDGSSAQLGPTSAQVKANAVDVENAAYKQGYYPSDLMIGRPLNTEETATDEQCKVDAHKDGSGNNPAGICATTGDIRMNFRHVMSQVKVELTSSASTDPDYIAFDANTKVEIIGGYKEGAIKLSDCTMDFTGKTPADYQLNNTAADDYDSYHDGIIPQQLTEGMKFRITTQNANGSTDTYEAIIKNIKVTEGSNPASLITAWESGKAYTYTLKITKTAINITATITDWVPVEASENIWF